MMDLTFYDRHGKPIVYTEDGEHIYLFNGRPVAYFYDDVVYSYSGKQLGWFEDGWIRDLHGRCALFTEDAYGGPARPARHARPAKGAKYAKPAKGARQARRAKAARSISWSELSGEMFFFQ